MTQLQEQSEKILERVGAARFEAGSNFHDELVESLYTEAARIADRAVTRKGERGRFDTDRTIDRLVTSRWLGFPLMLLMLTVVFWLTIEGANYPSAMLATLLVDMIHPLLNSGADSIGVPWWLSGLLIDGVYLAMAWVISVMLPPMAIFFPLFTLLEDFGYLPRVAFNLDGLFRRAGAHGKQALTMAMGFGCNAAAIVSTRVIDSPRERLIAIITNNFALCNGRWPTQILVATIFIGGLVPAHLAGLVSAAAVVGVAGGGLCHPRRCRDLAGVEYSGGRQVPGGALHRLHRTLRYVRRPQRCHPAGLRRRHPRQRDRHPDDPDADGAHCTDHWHG